MEKMDSGNMKELKNKKWKYNGIGIPIVNYKCKDYVVKFVHDQKFRGMSGKAMIKGKTIAYIKDENGEVVGKAVSFCSMKDNYCKRI